ncbi:XylR N-terminal domain-containing protein [Bradyrhizobium sp. CCGB20]|uniref:XylR N-terminal domain-containing protein n=1 Tax=Bradyrhizobium sp. CCGB20 TaxID=2949633 RepID=UPI0035C6D9B9
MRTDETRISLAEASRRAARILTRGASSELKSGAAPTFNDLAESLHFVLGDGRTWFSDQRMVLMQSQVLGRLRTEIIDAFGIETAKALFMRVGYMQGTRDAELIQKRFPNQDLTHALAAGPRVYTLEGFVKVTTRHFEFDSDKCTYLGEFLWEDSSEAAEHLASYGLASEPVCWLQVGYPPATPPSFAAGPSSSARSNAPAWARHAAWLSASTPMHGATTRRSASISDWNGRAARCTPPARSRSRQTKARPPQAMAAASRSASRPRSFAPAASSNASPRPTPPCSSSANPASARSCSPVSCTP